MSDVAMADTAIDDLVPDVRDDQAAPPDELSHRDDLDVGRFNRPEGDDAPRQRPDWLQEQFWNAEKGEADTEKLGKSYNELRNQFNADGHKVPEDGTYDTTEITQAGVDAQDPMLQSFTEWAKEFGVSQHAFSSLAKSYIENGQAGMEEEQRSIAEERSILGPKADDRIQASAQWLARMHSRGILNDADFEEARIMAGSAHGIQVFEKIQAFYGEKMAPIEASTDSQRPGAEELSAMVANPEYQTNAAYRAKVEKAFDAEYGGVRGDSQSLTVPMFRD